MAGETFINLSEEDFYIITIATATSVLPRIAWGLIWSYFWLPTAEPFTVERPRDECLQLMKADFDQTEKWILSGSITGWAETFTSIFDLVVFVYVPQDVRIERLKRREYERYGDEMLPGGGKHQSTKAFLEWAAAYDAGNRNGRSLPKHEAWLNTVACPVVKVINHDVEDSVKTVLTAVCEEDQ